MKYIITESQVETYFQSYLEKFRPELFNLSKDKLIRPDGTVYGYSFDQSETLYLFFEYFFKPENESYEFDDKIMDKYPVLRVTNKLRNELVGMFGEFNLHLVKHWFEKNYELPVKTII